MPTVATTNFYSDFCKKFKNKKKIRLLVTPQQNVQFNTRTLPHSLSALLQCSDIRDGTCSPYTHYNKSFRRTIPVQWDAYLPSGDRIYGVLCTQSKCNEGRKTRTGHYHHTAYTDMITPESIKEKENISFNFDHCRQDDF